MEAKGDGSRGEEKQAQGVAATTPEKRQQQAFLDGESSRPMKVTTHYLGGGGKGRSKSGGQFPPSSPTDRMLSPCSRKLLRKKTTSHESFSEVNFEFWAPPASVQLVLGSSSKSRSLILQDLGWTFSTMSPDIDERAIEEKCQMGPMSVPVLIAKAKATAILNQLKEQEGSNASSVSEEGEEGGTVVITSDQVVLFQNQVRGKPQDEAEARAFLESYQAGETCQTVTAVVATHLPSGRQASKVDICTVHWSGIPTDSDEGGEAALATLLAKEDVMYSCGGFLIEDEDFLRFVDHIEGDLDSIRGLPIKATKKVIYAVLSAAERSSDEAI